jgi:hypothetical protein
MAFAVGNCLVCLWHGDEDLDQIEVRIGDGESLWIMPYMLQHVLDLPTGSSKVLPDLEPNNQTRIIISQIPLKHVATRHKVKNPAVNRFRNNRTKMLKMLITISKLMRRSPLLAYSSSAC